MLLGCCTAAIDFLRRIGSLHLVEFHDRINVIDGATRLAIQASWLPAPLHLLPSIARTRYLTSRDKLRLARLLAGIVAHRPREGQSAAAYLKGLGCSEALLERQMEPVIVSALNEPTRDASASYARMVLLESFVKGKRSYRLGVPKAHQSEVIGDASLSWLRDRACEVRLGTRVRRVRDENSLVRGIELASGERAEFDSYVVAVPPSDLSKLGISAGAGRLSWRPIVSAHLFFRAPTPAFEPVCVAREPFGWVFSKRPDVGYVQVVASAAEQLIGRDKSELLDLAMRAARAAEPGLRGLPIGKGIIYRARHATFATLSCDGRRPPAVTSTGNLFLAGDWTDTGWPATIESAVRSGRAAARALAQAN